MSAIDGSRKLPVGLRLAKLAMDRSTYKIRVGASLITGGKIILAHNWIRSSPRALEWFKYPNQSHAEFNLFSRMLPPIKGTVSVYREFSDGSYALARPCQSCLAMLRYYGIRTIYFTMNGSWAKEKL